MTQQQIKEWEAYIKELHAWLKAQKAKKSADPADHPPPPPPHP